MNTISRPALRYFGGKWQLAPWIIGQFPRHTCYCEPFAGAGSVLLRKNRSPIEVYNDLDGDVVNFFLVLRERPAELIRAIQLTPWARAELATAYASTSDLDPLERARRLYVRCWQCRAGGRAQWRGGWRFMRNTKRGGLLTDDWQNTDRLWDIAARLTEIQIECDSALAVVARYDTPDTLFYCDPPYVADVRGERWKVKGYQHEMTDDDHRCMAEALRSIRGMAVVSGYDGALYRDLFPDWQRVSTSSVTEGRTVVSETLWLSPAVVERGQQMRFVGMEEARVFGGATDRRGSRRGEGMS